MLEVQNKVKIRKDNLYIICDGYKLKELVLDLETSIMKIKVEFYKNEHLIHIKNYDMGECGDTNVNDLIAQIHKTING